MTADNDYIDQLASSLSESVLSLAKVGYADQFITNGIEAYRDGETGLADNAAALSYIRNSRHKMAVCFDDPSGRIITPALLCLDYATQRRLAHLAHKYFRASDKCEEDLHESVLLWQMIQERGAALALVAELQRLLHRHDETGKTLLKLHQKGKLELFVDMTRGPKWWLLGDWESQRNAAVEAATTEAQRALNATMQPFSGEVVGRMFVRSFNKPAKCLAGVPGSCYKLRISSLPSTWDVEDELNKLIIDSVHQSGLKLKNTGALQSVVMDIKGVL